jgi:hypothetical protein
MLASVLAMMLGGMIAAPVFGVAAFFFSAAFSWWLGRRARLQQIAEWDLRASLFAPSAMSWDVLRWLVLASLIVGGIGSGICLLGLLIVPFLAAPLVFGFIFFIIGGSLLGSLAGGLLGVRAANQRISVSR